MNLRHVLCLCGLVSVTSCLYQAGLGASGQLLGVVCQNPISRSLPITGSWVGCMGHIEKLQGKQGPGPRLS